MKMPESQAITHARQVLARQHAAFLRDGPPDHRRRRSDLLRLKHALIRHRLEIADALQADYGHRSRHETAVMELLTVVQGMNHLLRHLRGWMRPSRRAVAWHFQPARNYVQYQPRGVIGIISPWNYPVSLALAPLATALAAGNRAMIKPSEFTPATSGLLQKILAALFPPDQVATICGDADVGAGFASLPFDHLVFTGSTPVGRAVMRAAAEHLVPVTLELGGKSPVVIAKGHAGAAAARIAYGKLANAGQTCIAPDYALLEAGEVEPFVRAFDKAVRILYPGGPTSGDYTAIINDHHHQRLARLLDDARAGGAKVIEVGIRPEDAALRPCTLAPALVLGVRDDMRIMQEEIFGPILPLRTCAGIDEAVGFINSRPRPLALYYFGAANADRDTLLSRTTSGAVSINSTLMHYAQNELPFGGVGPSGMGAYHGIEGFRALSHARAVHVQGRWNPADLLRPPYRRLTEFILRVMLR